MASVELQSITKRFGGVEVIRDLGLSVENGSFCAILGPSGCGKSTLLRMIAGLEEITSGRAFIGNVDVTHELPARRRVAMVFQNYALYPHLTVEQNICFSLSLAGLPKARQRERGMQVARLLQLESLMDRRPAQLSGGQRQRVAIGRALVREPEVFLFDEPLSNLDALLRVQMRLELAKLHNEIGTTMIYVTHDQVEAMTLADKIVLLDKGRISQEGSPLELYNHPANRFVAGFIGSPAMNFIPAQARRAEGGLALALQGGAAVSLPPRAAPAFEGERAVELGIRPEHLSFADDGPIAGQVSVVEQLGNTTFVYLDSEAGPLIVEADQSVRFHPGDRVRVRLDTARAHVFDESGKAWPLAA
jgi:multiple sugar transport system ATP-binding protein